jgi:hypothetical protein
MWMYNEKSLINTYFMISAISLFTGLTGSLPLWEMNDKKVGFLV